MKLRYINRVSNQVLCFNPLTGKSGYETQEVIDRYMELFDKFQSPYGEKWL